MSRIYLLDDISAEDMISTGLTVYEDDAGTITSSLSMANLIAYLFNLASTSDETNPFSDLDIAIGSNASSIEGGISIGQNTSSSEFLDVAIGNSCSASGGYSISFGTGSSASSYSCIATGYGCSASGQYGLCIGGFSVAAGYDLSEFFDSDVFNCQAIAIGHNNTSAGAANVVIGTGNLCAGFDPNAAGTVLGNRCSVQAFYGGTAIGSLCQSSDSVSTAIGFMSVANSEGSLAAGFQTTASGSYSVACGGSLTASGNYSSVFGVGSSVYGAYSTVVGYSSSCTSAASYSNAFGYMAKNSTSNVTNISGPIILRGDDDDDFNSSEQFQFYGGVQNVLATKDIDFTIETFSIISATPYGGGTGYTEGDTISVSGGGNEDAVLTVASVDEDGAPLSYTVLTPGTNYQTGSNIATTNVSSTGDGNATVDISVVQPTEIDLPFNSLFYIDSVSVILDNNLGEVTTQPVISCGWAGDSPNSAGILAPVQTTNFITLASREVYSNLLTYDGQQTLTFSINVAASASFLHGRCLFTGVLVENSPPST